MYTFAARGIYNSMSLIADHQTGSFWDHVTGECLHGAHKGHRLEQAPLRHTRTDQALAQFPDARIALSRLRLPFGLMDGLIKTLQRLGRGRLLPAPFAGSMGAEDPRRPRMDLGLGVWTDKTGRFYPLSALKANDNLLIDRFDDRKLLIYLDPVSGTPTPVFTDVQQAEWDAAELRLDSGAKIRNGRLYDPLGAELPTAQPLHLFSRWYGFSLTFPNCEIYGEADGQSA